MIFDNKEHNDIIGTIFLALSIVMLGFMLVSPFNHMIIHIDEYFTISVLNFPITELAYVISHDVHPPFHYLLLKVVTDILTILGLESNKLFAYKIMSIVPYMIILILSATKIKKEHGYLTAGLFAFSMAIMTEFFVFYSVIRMYSWAILFVVLAFIYLRDVLYKNDIKSWALLTIFSVLAAYTHYFAAIPIVCIYLALFVYFLMNDKQNLKYWILSAIGGMILFAPWILPLMTQVTGVSSGFWIPPITFKTFVSFFGFFVTPRNFYLNVFAIVIFIALLINTLRSYSNINKTDRFYIICGISAYVGTILIGTIASLLLKPLMVNRYLLPSAAILWFTISFMISKMENKKQFLISFALILILLVAGAGQTISSQDFWAKNQMDKEAFFDHVCDNNDTIVINDANNRMFFMEYANSTEMYLLNPPKTLYGYDLSEVHDTFDFKEITKKDVPKLIKNNPDKEVYIICKKSNSYKDLNTTEIIKSGNYIFLKVD